MICEVVLSRDLHARIEAEARAAFPAECCGLLEGVRDGETVRIAAIHPTCNLADAPGRFAIDPQAHIRLLRALRGTGRAIVGCYHSHPEGRAEPSAHDREAAVEENFIWLIAAVPRAGAATLAAFVYATGSFRTLALSA